MERDEGVVVPGRKLELKGVTDPWLLNDKGRHNAIFKGLQLQSILQ